jgi:hypothetical protein
MVLRDCGQPSGDPSGVRVQSSARMRAPIAPPPARNSRPLGGGAFRGKVVGVRVDDDIVTSSRVVPAGQRCFLPCGRRKNSYSAVARRSVRKLWRKSRTQAAHTARLTPRLARPRPPGAVLDFMVPGIGFDGKAQVTEIPEIFRRQASSVPLRIPLRLLRLEDVRG